MGHGNTCACRAQPTHPALPCQDQEATRRQGSDASRGDDGDPGASCGHLRFRGAADEKGPAMPKPSQGVTVVALLADPDTPTEIAERMARRLPDRLSRKSDKGRRFDVRVVSEPVTAGSEDPPTVMRRIRERANAEDWDVEIGRASCRERASKRSVLASDIR